MIKEEIIKNIVNIPKINNKLSILEVIAFIKIFPKEVLFLEEILEEVFVAEA